MRLDEFIAQLEAAGWRPQLDAQHQRITELWRAEYPGAASYLDDLAALRAELQKVRSAAISGMDAATQHGHSLVQQAARLKAESNPDALESERAANALLTEQLQKAEADLAALRAERDALRAALIEATEMVEHWGGYASDYFQKKWNLEGDLTKLRAAIAAESQS